MKFKRGEEGEESNREIIILAMAKRFIPFGLRHNSFPFKLVSGSIIANTNEQIGVRKPEFRISTYKKNANKDATWYQFQT